MGRLRRSIAASVAIALSIFVAGCNDAADGYFYRPSSIGVSIPSVVGVAVYLGAGTIEALPGDTIQLESLEPVGIVGFTEIDPLVRPASEAVGGLVGAVTEQAMAESMGIGPEAFRPLAGYEFDAADGPIEVLVRIDGTEAVGRFDTLILTFRVNGSKPQEQDLKFAGAACFAPTAPPASEPPCDAPDLD